MLEVFTECGGDLFLSKMCFLAGSKILDHGGCYLTLAEWLSCYQYIIACSDLRRW